MKIGPWIDRRYGLWITRTLISILALGISALSFFLSLHNALRDSARVKATSVFYPPSQEREEERRGRPS